MATDTSKIMLGAGVVSVGAYVTAAGAGTLVDIGHTKSPVTLQVTAEHYDLKSERAFGTLKKLPIDATYKLKVPATESILENWRVATKQAAGNLSGTPPDLTLLVGDAQEQYHQIQIVTVGVGTTGVRTVTAWRAALESVSEIPFAKGAEQLLEMTFDLLHDDSVVTADKVLKAVDA